MRNEMIRKINEELDKPITWRDYCEVGLISGACYLLIIGGWYAYSAAKTGLEKNRKRKAWVDEQIEIESGYATK